MNDSVDSMMDRKPGLSNISEFSSLGPFLQHVSGKEPFSKLQMEAFLDCS